MANKELNKALFKKMGAENQQFQKWLISQSKEEILNHAFEYITKNDILMAVEGNTLSDEQVLALLQSPSPLEDAYKEFKEIEFDLMDDIQNIMKDLANDWIEEQKEAKTITVIKVEPGKVPKIKSIEDSLESLQNEVGGDIEAVYPFEDQVGLICNQESKFNGMQMNRCLRHPDTGNVYDIVYGPFLIAGLGEEDFASLSPDLVQKYMNEFKQPEMFLQTDDGIIVLPMPTEDFPMNQEFDEPSMTEQGM